jgi:peptidoglycan LD-endopeptidase LytH
VPVDPHPYVPLRRELSVLDRMSSRTGGWALLCLLALLLALLPATASDGSVQDARAERQRIQARLDDAARDLARSEDRAARLEARHDELSASVAAQEAELADIDERTVDRVRQVYKHGTTVEPMVVFLASDDPDAALDRAGAVRRLVHGDRAEAEEVHAARERLRADIDRLEELDDELQEVLARHRERAAEIERDLDQARETEQRLVRQERERERERERARERERERERQQQAAAAAPEPTTSSAPAPGGSGMVCPIDQPRSFTDTWGDARSGGRSHRGTDILSPMGTPIRAITSGVWDIRSPGPNAGLWAILRGDDGNQYWYMHLQSHTVADGARVSAGQQTGTNGDTGNARGTPHLHFELHPGGGSAVNPYSLLRRVC